MPELVSVPYEARDLNGDPLAVEVIKQLPAGVRIAAGGDRAVNFEYDGCAAAGAGDADSEYRTGDTDGRHSQQSVQDPG